MNPNRSSRLVLPLSATSVSSPPPPLPLRLCHPARLTFNMHAGTFADLTVRQTRTRDEVMRVMQFGMANKSMASTLKNERSSRSFSSAPFCFRALAPPRLVPALGWGGCGKQWARVLSEYLEGRRHGWSSASVRSAAFLPPAYWQMKMRGSGRCGAPPPS